MEEDTEDARHFVMECPRWQMRPRSNMFDSITYIDDGSGQAMLNSQRDTLLVLLGRPIHGFTEDQMIKVWYISVVHISSMYNERLREGIG